MFYFSQPKNDTLPALEVIKEYLGILHEYPDTTDIYRRSLSKLKESDRMRDEGRIDVSLKILQNRVLELI